MTRETLSLRERQELLWHPDYYGAVVVKALRIIDALEDSLNAATAEAQAWKDAYGPFGPQTPAEVKVFEEEGRRVSAEQAEHEKALRDALEARAILAENALREARRVETITGKYTSGRQAIMEVWVADLEKTCDSFEQEIRELKSELEQTNRMFEHLNAADRIGPEDRAVLDAMQVIPDGTFSCLAELNVITFSSSVMDALKSEIARRKAKAIR